MIVLKCSFQRQRICQTNAEALQLQWDKDKVNTHVQWIHSGSNKCIIPPELFPAPIPWFHSHARVLDFAEAHSSTRFFTVGCAQLKSRHIEKYNKRNKSVHLAETNQSWHCKSPGTYVQRKQKLKHTCLAAFLFQLSPFGWSGSVFSPAPPFSVWRADRNLCHNKPQEPCTYH